MGMRCKYDIYHSSSDGGRRGASKVLCAEMRAAHVFWICVSLLITITAGDQLACRHVSVISG